MASPRRSLGRIRPSLLTTFAAVLTIASSTLAQQAGVGEQIFTAKTGGGTARFHAAGVDPAKFPPSIALAAPVDVKPTGPVSGAIKAKPIFYTATDGRFCVKIDIDAGTSLYGTGEIAGPLLRNGHKTVCWNTDSYGYTDQNLSLYQSHPWVLAVRADGSAFGVLADTTWRCEIDLTGESATDAPGGKVLEPGPGGSIVFRGEGASFPVYVIDRASPQEVVMGLADLVGTIPLPPKWALGYHQCRYSYNPESRVREIADGFRSRKIPCDVIWFDIDYMDGYRIFTFDKTQFPDPKKLNDDLGDMGFHRIWMIDPGVKAEKGYAIADQMVEHDYAVKTAKGDVYRGEVWPGWCYYPDYTRPDVRQWWSGLYKDFIAQGVSGVWNDMNEPAVFNVKSKTMPEDNVHKGGTWDTGGTLPQGPHLQYHNVFGLMMAKGTYDGILKARPDKRPFVLTRAGYMGSHRYAATWTGDNSATWEDLGNSISMAGNMSVSGSPFIGPDIGGFNGNGDGKLFARWMGFGSLLPFCRGHTGKGNIDKEPWAFGPEVEQSCRLALERRYVLMPYLYTLFHEASRSGLPVLRPTFFADPTDPALRSEQDSFLLGSDLLVEVKTTPEADRAPVMPKGVWNEFFPVNEGHHPDLPRLYIRGGAIIPAGPVMQYTDQKKLDPLTLFVSLDEAGSAIGKLYEDDGDGFGYKDEWYNETTYVAKTDGTRIKLEVLSKEGKRTRFQRDLHVVFITPAGFYMGAATDGQSFMIDMKEIAPGHFSTTPPPAPKPATK